MWLMGSGLLITNSIFRKTLIPKVQVSINYITNKEVRKKQSTERNFTLPVGNQCHGIIFLAHFTKLIHALVYVCPHQSHWKIAANFAFEKFQFRCPSENDDKLFSRRFRACTYGQKARMEKNYYYRVKIKTDSPSFEP